MNRRANFFLSIVVVFLLVPLIRVHAEIENESDNEREEQIERVVPPAPVPINTNTTVTSPSITNQTINAPAETPAIVTIPTPTVTAPAPVTSVAPATTPSPWPWYLTRAFGIASFWLLFTSAVVGILMTTGAMHRLFSPASSWSLHRTTGIFLILSILIHLTSLLFDRFINLRIQDVLIPFVSPYQPLLVTLGIFGFYIFIPVIWTSLVWIDKKSWLWRTTHILSFPMFVAIFFHALLLGTDRHQPWMVAIFWITGLTMGLLVAYRLIWKLRAGRQK